MCIQQKLTGYSTKDIKVKTVIDKVNSCFGQINAIKDKAQMIAQQQAGSSNFGFNTANVSRDQYDDGRTQSYLNDITSIASGITNFVQKGANMVKNAAASKEGHINSQMINVLKEADEK